MMGMKRLLFLIVFLLTACAPMQAAVQTSLSTQNASAASQVQSTPAMVARVQASPVATTTTGPTFTPTAVPTATTNYQEAYVQAQALAGTAQAQAGTAQAQIDAINRQMIDVTVQSNMLTATADGRKFQIIQWTAEAPPTPTPNLKATQTQSAITVMFLKVASGEMTSTHEAPTRMYAMTQAAQESKSAQATQIIDFMG